MFSKRLRAFECADDLVLLGEQSGHVLLLNGTAAFIWRSLSAGESWSAVRDQIVAATNADSDQVARDIDALVDVLRGLDVAHPAQAAGAPAVATTPAAGTVTAPRKAQDRRHRDGPLPDQAQYRVLDFAFNVRTHEPDAHLIVEALFAHLSIGAADSRAMATFEVVRDVHNSWSLLRNGDRLTGCESLAGLAPLLHTEISMSAYEHTDRLVGLHAAVIVRGGHALLLPAESGNGKSTLTAALAADGCDSCSDDLAILTRRPIKLRPAPVCIGLKSGSLQPLMSKLPALAKLPVYTRADGRSVRYFPPPAKRLASNGEAYAVATIVFPRYEAGARLSCRRIGPGDGLVRLARAGYDAELNADVLSALIEWLEEVEIYSLRYGDLDQAVAAVGRLTR